VSWGPKTKDLTGAVVTWPSTQMVSSPSRSQNPLVLAVVHMQRVSLGLRGEVLDDRDAACPPPVEALMMARMH